MHLPDPQILSDAHGLGLFASAVSQPSVNLLNGTIKNPEDQQKIKSYFDECVGKLEDVISKIKAEVSRINFG